MSDLLGDDFYELVSRSIDSQGTEQVSLSARANLYVPVKQGTIFVYSNTLVDALKNPDFSAEVRTIANMIDSFDKRFARGVEPVGKVFQALCDPEENEQEIKDYRFVTRQEVIRRGTVHNTAVFSRVVQELEGYGLMRTLVPRRGAKPKINVIDYPFTPDKPVTEPVRVNAVIDMSGHRPMAKAAEADRELRLVDMRRQALHRSRPHASHHADGRPITVYSRTTEVRTPSGEVTTVEMTARTFEGTDTPVMSKQDDLKFSILLGWCLIEIRARKRIGAPLDDWFVLTPEALAEHLGFTDLSSQVYDMSRMIERWRDTQVTAEALIMETEEAPGEFARYLAQDTMTQFSQHQATYKETRKGRRITAIRFKLTPDVQKDLERRANSDADEKRIENLAAFLIQNSSRTLMSDSFAIALNHFFWTWARNFRRVGGWSFELWEGLSQVFDFEFPLRKPGMSAAEWNRVYARSRTQFNRMLQKFLGLFSKDSNKDWETWTSFEGGDIVVDMLDCRLEIHLEPRSKNERNKGTVCIKALPKKLQNSPAAVKDLPSEEEIAKSTDMLLQYGVSKKAIPALAKGYSFEHIEKCVHLVQCSMDAKPDTIGNPTGLLITFIKEKHPDVLDIELAEMRLLAEKRRNRRAVSEKLHDFDDLDF
ncbi:hypothetical protein [Marinobacterium stanieri]|uniref:Uncharacterized protein n=1 Tax=Marinobacterium stanieri TaxID=49186 RepID=A0A1N6XIA9_9GAMM|nr:hypothetical protein [Marinobacterium stanieri]SIR02033.1 hypothetical protein SAMN05421647_11441 [Marinobacterium stanieri]